MSGVVSRDFASFLKERRDALSAKIVAELPEHASDAAADKIVQSAQSVIANLITIPGEDRAKGWAREWIVRELEQEVGLEMLGKALALTSRHLVRCAREAVELGVAGARDGLEQLYDACSELAFSLACYASERSKERYRELYERTPAMMHSIDVEGRLVTVSDLWLETLGFTREEVLGRRSVELLTPESRHYAREVTFPVLRETGYLSAQPFEFVKKNGQVIDVLLSAIALRNEAGATTHFLAVLTDVTEQLRTARALREGEERYRRLVELSPIAIGAHQHGKVIYMNSAGLSLLGATSPDQIIGKPAINLVHPDSIPLAKERVQRMLANGEPVNAVEQRWLRVDGTPIDVEVTAAPSHQDGDIAMQIVFWDVTERKRAQAALREAALHKEMIRAQSETLRALSTPLIPVSRGVVVMPLVGAIDEVRAEQIIEVLLAGVSAHRASYAILDVTGVPRADTTVADALLRATRAVGLLGAKAILTGLSPIIARVLAHDGADFEGLVTLGTLESGIAYAMRRQR